MSTNMSLILGLVERDSLLTIGQSEKGVSVKEKILEALNRVRLGIESSLTRTQTKEREKCIQLFEERKQSFLTLCEADIYKRVRMGERASFGKSLFEDTSFGNAEDNKQQLGLLQETLNKITLGFNANGSPEILISGKKIQLEIKDVACKSRGDNYAKVYSRGTPTLEWFQEIFGFFDARNPHLAIIFLQEILGIQDYGVFRTSSCDERGCPLSFEISPKHIGKKIVDHAYADDNFRKPWEYPIHKVILV